VTKIRVATESESKEPNMTEDIERIRSKILCAEEAVVELSVARRNQNEIISNNIRHLEKVAFFLRNRNRSFDNVRNST
jgi:hypothetical protein